MLNNRLITFETLEITKTKHFIDGHLKQPSHIKQTSHWNFIELIHEKVVKVFDQLQ